MSQVTVTIDGKAYRMACEEGQEGHLTELAAKFDRYVGHLKSQFGEIGDLRLTVMAGIMVMDELSEATRKAAALEAELDTVRTARDSLLATTTRADETLVEALDALTGQVHEIAARIAGQAEARPGDKSGSAS
jgi:cell division protein ZapA